MSLVVVAPLARTSSSVSVLAPRFTSTEAIPFDKVAVTPVPTKLTVPATPIEELSSWITIPVPWATIPVSPEPSPTNCCAVTFLPTLKSVLIATVTALMFKLFGESIVGVPALELSNLVAVTTPVTATSPSTSSFDAGSVEPIPTL